MVESIPIAKEKDIPPGESRVFIVRGCEIAVFNVDGRFYAINNHCPHQGGPLVVGSINGKVLTCPWHFWQFDLETGKSPSNASISVGSYPVEINANKICIQWKDEPSPYGL